MNRTEIKIITGLLIVAVLSLAITPVPAYAGNSLGLSIIGIVLGIVISVLCYGVCAPFVAAALGVSLAVIQTVQIVAQVAILGMQAYITSTCSGHYDPVFGTCTTSKNISQQIFTTSNAKFTNIDMSVPSPEEFDRNPDVGAAATVGWQADARPGLVNYLVVSDKDSGTRVFSSSGTDGNVCSAGSQDNVFNSLSYDTTYVAKIWFASCWQIRSRSRGAVPTCSGCGSDIVGAQIEFTTPALPPLGVDIKANGKDGGLAFVPGIPVELSWTSLYASSCSAEGSWSGSKPTSGTKTVTPLIGNEVYTIVCSRPGMTANPLKTQTFGPQPLTSTTFDFSSVPGAVSISSIKISYDWCWEDGGTPGCFNGTKNVAVGETGLIFSSSKDDGSHGVPGPNCLGYSGNSDAYDYCMSIYSSKWEGKKLILEWEGITDRYLNDARGKTWLTRFEVTAAAYSEITAQDSVSAVVSLPGFQISTSSLPMPNGSSSNTNTNGKSFLHEVIP